MAKQKDIAFFENKLLDFMTSSDPMLEMMRWVAVNLAGEQEILAVYGSLRAT